MKDNKRIILSVILIILIGVSGYFAFNIGNKSNNISVTFMVDNKVYEEVKLTKEENKISSLPEAPYKEGYTFKYWEYNGKEFDINEEIERSIKIVAVYEKDETTISPTPTAKPGNPVVTPKPNTPTPTVKPSNPTVTPKPNSNQTVEVTSISIPSSATIKVNEGLSLNVVVNPSNASDKTVTWTSSNTSIVIVSNGLIKGLKEGVAIITAKSNNGKIATCKVTVNKQTTTNTTVGVTGITLDNTSSSIEVGKKLILTATINPTNASNKTVTWTSSNTSIASVNNKGEVTGIKVGTATISATTSNGKIAKCTVIVKPYKSPNVEIKTATDNYLIDGSNKGHVSKTYYSNDTKVTLKLSTTESGVTEFVYSNATSLTTAEQDNNKKTVSLNNPNITITLPTNKSVVFYIWSMDSKGNKSHFFTKLLIKYDHIIFKTDDYTYKVYNKNASKYGQVLYNKDKYNKDINGKSIYERFAPEQKDLLVRYFNKLTVKANSNNITDKRNTVLKVAEFATTYLNYQIPYIRGENGKYPNKGLNITDNKKCWGCLDNSYGFQCSGFVSWVLINSGLKFKANNTSFLNSAYLAGYYTPYNWIITNGYQNKFKNINYDNDIYKSKIVSDNNIYKVSEMTTDKWKKVKVGDIIGYDSTDEGTLEETTRTKGHIGIIIGVNDTYIYIAHSALRLSWYFYDANGKKEDHGINGPQIARYKKSDLKNTSWDHIILMDEVYKSGQI